MSLVRVLKPKRYSIVVMSIRLLAIELYKQIKEVEELEKKLDDSPLAIDVRNELNERLRRVRAERDRIKAMLEGAKQ